MLSKRVVQNCINFSSKPGDLVLDPFMGNGTTAVVAKEHYRHFIGFEINENIRERITEDLTSTQVGVEYTSYKSRLPTPEKLRERYPRVYKIYMKQKRYGL